jgi:hypothetical protein
MRCNLPFCRHVKLPGELRDENPDHRWIPGVMLVMCLANSLSASGNAIDVYRKLLARPINRGWLRR